MPQESTNGFARVNPYLYCTHAMKTLEEAKRGKQGMDASNNIAQSFALPPQPTHEIPHKAVRENITGHRRCAQDFDLDNEPVLRPTIDTSADHKITQAMDFDDEMLGAIEAFHWV